MKHLSCLRAACAVVGLCLAAPLAAFAQAAAPADAPASAALAVVDSAAAPPAGGLAVPSSERLEVTDPYLEMRTGPGRGYPIFHVVGRHEWVEVELRHTDWYKVRTDAGQVGWVRREQLASTLTAAGERKSFRDIVLDDYLSRRVSLGAAWGHFAGEPMLKAWTGYRLSETLGVEATYGQVQGVFSGTDFWSVDLTAEPWSDRRLSPFFEVGVGKFQNFPNLSLVGAATTNSKQGHAAIGLFYHLGDRFVLRSDYSIYTVFVSDTQTIEYRAFSVGLGFFF